MAEHLGTATLARLGTARSEAVDRTVPTLPRDADRRLCAALGIRPKEPLRPAEIAALLSGNTTSGSPIAGLTRRRASRSLADALGLEPGEIPDAAATAMFAQGRQVDGTPFPEREAGSILRRLHEAFGVPGGRPPTPRQAANVAAGLFADGTPACGRRLARRLHHRAEPIAYRDFTFAPDKSVSIAWAVGSEAERSIVEAAHQSAVEQTMADIIDVVGRVRLGDGGRRGRFPGATLHLSFTHYTARATGVGGVRPGDMHLHTQATLLNVVRLASGRLGGLDLGQLAGRTHEFGALYQARIAAGLRRSGIAVVLDAERGCARVAVIPDAMIELFSERTNGGRASLEKHLAATGAAAADLTHRRRVALMKQGVQGDPMSERRDDVADKGFWRKAAAAHALGPIAQVDLPRPPSEPERLEEAVRCATLFLEKAGRGDRTISAREAAARGLIAAGIEKANDVDRVAAKLNLREKGDAVTTAARASAGDVIAAKRSDGTAILVEGGAGDVLAAAVSRRAELEATGVSARIVVATYEEAIVATRAARRHRSEQGLLDPDSYSVAIAAGPAGADRIELAVGDIVAFGQAVNGRGLRGRVAAAGTPVKIVAIDDDGLTVVNAKGRRASISRQSVSEPGGAAVAVGHGYALVGPATIAEPAVIAATEGSRKIGAWAPPRACDHVVFGHEVEAAERPEGAADDADAVWREIADNFSRKDRQQTRAIAENARRNASDVTLRGRLLIERTPQQALASIATGPSAALMRSLSRVSGLVNALVSGIPLREPEGTAYRTPDRLRGPAASAAAGAAALADRPVVHDAARPAADHLASEALAAPAHRISPHEVNADRSTRQATPSPVTAGSRAAASAVELASVDPSIVEAIAADLTTTIRQDRFTALGARLSRLLAASRFSKTLDNAPRSGGEQRARDRKPTVAGVDPASGSLNAKAAAPTTTSSSGAENASPSRRHPLPGSSAPEAPSHWALAALRAKVSHVASRASELAEISDEAIAAFAALSHDASQRPGAAVVNTLVTRLTNVLANLAPRLRAIEREGPKPSHASEAFLDRRGRSKPAAHLQLDSEANAPKHAGSERAAADAHLGRGARRRNGDAAPSSKLPPVASSAVRLAPAVVHGTQVGDIVQPAVRGPRHAERPGGPTVDTTSEGRGYDAERRLAAQRRTPLALADASRDPAIEPHVESHRQGGKETEAASLEGTPAATTGLSAPARDDKHKERTTASGEATSTAAQTKTPVTSPRRVKKRQSRKRDFGR